MVMVVVVVLAVSLAQTVGVLFFGQSHATCPCSQHWKQQPSFANWVHSSGVSHLNQVALAALTSIRTMFEFNKLELVRGWVGPAWEVLKSHGRC